MSDIYFDGLRGQGEYPRKDYNRQTESEKLVEIQRKINSGWREPWVLREANRLNISVPN